MDTKTYLGIVKRLDVAEYMELISRVTIYAGSKSEAVSSQMTGRLDSADRGIVNSFYFKIGSVIKEINAKLRLGDKPIEGITTDNASLDAIVYEIMRDRPRIVVPQ